MPHLVKVQDKYKRKGLALIAIHRQSGSLKGNVMALAQSKGVNYTITQSGSLRGDTSRGIPRAWLFDHTGKCVWEGHPTKIDGKLDEVMSRAPHWLTRGRVLKSKRVRQQSLKLSGNRNFGKIANELAKIAEKSEGTDKEEATFLRDNIMNYGNSRLTRAGTNEKADAVTALNSYAELGSLFKGTEIGDKATKRKAELKKDKAFQNELKAAEILVYIDRNMARMRPGGSKKRYNLRLIRNVRSAAAMLQKKYPTTSAAAKAQSIASSLK